MAGIVKVAHLLLLLLVAVLGAPDAEIDKLRTSLRTAFRTSLLQNPTALLNVPRHLGFLNARLLQIQGRVTEAVDREITDLLCTEIDAPHVESFGVAPNLQPIFTVYVDALTARLLWLETQLQAGVSVQLQLKLTVFNSGPLLYVHSGPSPLVAPLTVVSPPGPSTVVAAVAAAFVAPVVLRTICS